MRETMPAPMRYYPLFLDLEGKSVLVAGAGEVGIRKARTVLLANPACLDLLDPSLDAESEAAIRAALPCKQLRLHSRPFDAADITGRCLVFAATGNREVNALIASLCREKNILCNVADAPDEGAFIVPSVVNGNGLTIALSTGGQSPALARSLRRELEAWVETRYTFLLIFLGRLRPLLLALGLPTEKNSELLRFLVASPLADMLRNRERDAAVDFLTSTLPEPLHPRIGDLLDGI